MNFIDEAKQERAFLQRSLKNYRKFADIVVDGEIRMREKDNGGIEYYLKETGKKRRYLGKKDEELITKARMKKLGATGTAIIERNIERINRLICEYEDYSLNAIWTRLPKEYRLANIDLHDFDALGRKKPVIQSEDPNYREALIHMTSFGLLVRSKNEMIIAEELHAAGLDFRYEKAMDIRIDGKGNTKTVYPDFTIFLPDGRVKYWEHKGLYTNREYRDQDYWKTTMYYFNGIFPPKNLITTMDGPNGEFNLMDVRTIIRSLQEEMKNSASCT